MAMPTYVNLPVSNSDEIVKEICIKYMVRREDVLSRSRYTTFVRARKEIARAIASRYPKTSLHQIGKIINKDHATIIYYLRGRKTKQI
jgi:chromosomal replication initiation ATPase DnaA